MASYALDSSCHGKVRAIHSCRTGLARSCLRVWVECTRFTWFLNDEARLAEVTNRAWIPFIDLLTLWSWRF